MYSAVSSKDSAAESGEVMAHMTKITVQQTTVFASIPIRLLAIFGLLLDG
jgi:hypothetical protein